MHKSYSVFLVSLSIDALSFQIRNSVFGFLFPANTSVTGCWLKHHICLFVTLIEIQYCRVLWRMSRQLLRKLPTIGIFVQAVGGTADFME